MVFGRGIHSVEIAKKVLFESPFYLELGHAFLQKRSAYVITLATESNTYKKDEPSSIQSGSIKCVQSKELRCLYPHAPPLRKFKAMFKKKEALQIVFE